MFHLDSLANRKKKSLDENSAQSMTSADGVERDFFFFKFSQAFQRDVARKLQATALLLDCSSVFSQEKKPPTGKKRRYKNLTGPVKDPVDFNFVTKTNVIWPIFQSLYRDWTTTAKGRKKKKTDMY